MTNLTINNTDLKKSFDQDKKLGDVIDHVFNQEIDNETVLVNLHVDGQIIPFEEGLDISKSELAKFSRINFETQSSVELAFDAVESCNDYIDVLNEKIINLTRLYQAGESQKANEEFSDMIDILDLYVQLFAKIHTTLKRVSDLPKATSEDIQKLDIHLLSVLKALIPAKEKNDVIMLCDLLEYELVDNLTQWKIKIIPSLKKLKPSIKED
jgi:hypothetical protein